MARRLLLCVLLVVPVLGGGWLWLRNSRLVAVEHVRIGGVQGVGAQQIDAALERSAKQMSTLDMHPGALQAAVASFPQVRSLRVSVSFPHSLTITVREQPPVAVLVVDGQRTALASDGVVLGSSFVSGALPVINGQTFESAHIHNWGILEYLTVLGAAPHSLEDLVTRAYTTSKGLTLTMHGGLLVYFGDASRPHAKWASLARVLSDPSSSGASYIDVRLPERPAAGFSGESTGSQSTQSSGLDPNSAALAETLEGAITGSPAPPPSSQPATTTTEAQSSEGEAPAGTAAGSTNTESPPPEG